MYNSKFHVKYFDIEQELLQKQQTNLLSEYSREDVELICDKLYRDELLSVFYSEGIEEDAIDINMKYVYEKMISNQTFDNWLNELNASAETSDEQNGTISKEDCKYILFMTLFSQPFFHLMHKCVVQQLEQDGYINNELLEALKDEVFKQLK